jgi:hypothetical protein
MHRLRGEAAAERRRLLRVLLLWLGTLSADPGRAFERNRSGFLLRGLGRGQHFRPILTRLAWQYPHQPAGVVGASRGHACRIVPPTTRSCRRLDRCAHLDGLGVYLECKTVRTYALSLHRAVLSRDDRSGACDCFQRCLCQYLCVDCIGRCYRRRQRDHLVGHRASVGKIFTATRSSA